MASRILALALAAAFMAVFAISTSAQSTSGCTTAIVGLSPCLGYITGNSSTPSASCCTQLASVVKSEPQCLCMVLNGDSSQYGITINQTQALTLPSACKVQTPPVSQCKSAGGPTASPATPTNPSPSTPSTSSGPQGGGSKATPGVGTSDGSSTRMSFSLVFFLLFLVSYASTTITLF